MPTNPDLNHDHADELIAEAHDIDATPFLVKLLTPWRRYGRRTTDTLLAAQVCATLAVADELRLTREAAARCIYCRKGDGAGELIATTDGFEPLGPGLTHEACEAQAYTEFRESAADWWSKRDRVDRRTS